MGVAGRNAVGTVRAWPVGEGVAAMQWSEYSTAERLKRLRGAMTQEQLAEAANVSVGVVRKLERGGTASLPSLLSIASALGTDIAVLLGQLRMAFKGVGCKLNSSRVRAQIAPFPIRRPKNSLG